MFAVLIRRLLRRNTVVRSQETPVDLSWFSEVESSVTGEARRSAVAVCGEFDRLLGVFHRGARIGVDVERGSLALELPGEGAWRFSVDDVISAEQLAAASRLGGLLVRLSAGGEGLIRLHGVWGRHAYSVSCLPASDVVLP